MRFYKGCNYFLIFLCSIVFSSFLLGKTSKPPIYVHYGLFVKKLSVDFKASTFHSEFYWWAIFTNDSTKTGISNDDILQFEYVNGIDVEVGSIKNEMQYSRKNGDTSLIMGFHQGEFYFTPDFSMYPFDEQVLDIIVENSLFPSSELIFISDSSSYIVSQQLSHLRGLSDDLIKSNKTGSYHIHKTDIAIVDGIYNTNFGDTTAPNTSYYSRIKASILINRSFLPYISKLIIPLIIILILVYFVFFLPAEKLDIAAGLTVTSLLSAIAFQTAVSTDIPEIGYIIYIDKVFYTCYFLIALSMAQSLITYYLDFSGEEKKVKLASQLDYIFRFLFPLLFLAAVILFAL
jgi:hypothetical protein